MIEEVKDTQCSGMTYDFAPQFVKRAVKEVNNMIVLLPSTVCSQYKSRTHVCSYTIYKNTRE